MAQDAGFLGTAPAAGSQALLVTSRAIVPAELAQAVSAAGCPVETLGVIEAGDWLMYVDGAPAYVNAGFLQELAAGTPFYVRCKATGAAAFTLFTAQRDGDRLRGRAVAHPGEEQRDAGDRHERRGGEHRAVRGGAGDHAEQHAPTTPPTSHAIV